MISHKKRIWNLFTLICESPLKTLNMDSVIWRGWIARIRTWGRYFFFQARSRHFRLKKTVKYASLYLWENRRTNENSLNKISHSIIEVLRSAWPAGRRITLVNHAARPSLPEALSLKSVLLGILWSGKLHYFNERSS